MDESDLRQLIEQVRIGRLDRRRFIQAMVALGLTVPMATQMLAATGIAHAQPKSPSFTPTKRGGGGQLRVLWWQAPTLLNPHFATGTKDQDASRIFYEPLAGYDPDGNIVPALAAEVPSVDNGGLAKDGTWVKAVGTHGSGPNQFSTPHGIASDMQGNIYVGDRGNNRIQVFDNDGTFKNSITAGGDPEAICISPGAHQYLYSSNSNDSESMDHGEIYKIQLNGQVVGRFGKAGKMPKEFGMVNALDCRAENDLWVGEIWNWRAQKVTLKR